MKTNNIIRSLLFALPFAALLSACSEEFIALETGKLPDEASFATLKSSMRSAHSFSGVTIVDIFAQEEGEEPEITAIDELVLTLSKPAPTDLTAEIVIGSEFSAEYNAEVERRNQQRIGYFRKCDVIVDGYMTAFVPSDNLQMNAKITIGAGKTSSEKIGISISNAMLDPETIYSLPLTIKLSDGSSTLLLTKLEYIISVDKLSVKIDNPYCETTGKIEMNQELFTVLYLNVEEYQPQAANVLTYMRTHMDEGYLQKHYTLAGNIVNLRPSTVGYAPESQRVIFSLSPDLNYVLENSARYIRPLQAAGRKVCICIQGGGKGIGFCNMSDAQIEDFTDQVKTVIETYGIDGINLRDEGSAYGKEGFPPMNTTSYPKLIKSLREALPGKLLTLVDKEEPTEYFHDAALCGGIEVGKYIDYAWHGYAEEDQLLNIVEPWEAENPYSKFTRKPIAGFSREKYGSIVIPMASASFDRSQQQSVNIFLWKRDGRMKNKMYVIYPDITGKLAGDYEGKPAGLFNYVNFIADQAKYYTQRADGRWRVRTEKYSYDMVPMTSHFENGYNRYFKDW